MKYKDFKFKVPKESSTYLQDSKFVIENIKNILKKRIDEDLNKIVINTNLRFGLPLENINKIAGPIIEAWCFEVFSAIKEDPKNHFSLVNVEAQPRLGVADVVLQFKKGEKHLTGNVDVKATSEDIPDSGKGPNITSFSRIRTEYIQDPDFIFVILSIKHKVYSEKNSKTQLVDGVMEITDYNAYDLKLISEEDINYNPALGTGQIQIKDIHYISYKERTTWEFCKLLDSKYLKSSKRTIKDWYNEAIKHGWIKDESN